MFFLLTFDYILLLTLLFGAFGLSTLIILLNFIVSYKKPSTEKLSAYECGFDPFEDARNNFDIKFYLVAILFILFDLEIAFLYPWACTLGLQTFFGYWNMIIFLLILTLGFGYEWIRGALDWD